MGNIGSKKEETPRQRKERLEKTKGILIPPSFVMANGTNIYRLESMSLSTQAKLKVNPHDVLDFIWTANPGCRLLEEYMTPGIHLSVPTSTSTTSVAAGSGQLQVSLDATSLQESKNSSPQRPGQQIWVGHTTQAPQMQWEGLMDSNSSPSMRVSYRPTPKYSVATKLNANSSSADNTNSSWLDIKYQTRTNGIDCMLGAWMTGDAVSTLSSITSKNASSKKVSQNSNSNIHLQGAAEYQDSILAAHAQVPLQENGSQSRNAEWVSTLVSINLNQQSQNETTKQPPLWLTLYNKKGGGDAASWKLNLSQLFTFDRQVLNILEDRAPMVRQTVGWAVQVQQPTTQNDDSTKNNNSNIWSMGATWQWNRGFALKGCLLENGRVLKYGAILKRWEQPRVTLSLLNQWDFVARQHSFLGFGVEVETTPVSLLGGSSADGGEDESTLLQPSFEQSAPPTKIKIPKGTK